MALLSDWGFFVKPDRKEEFDAWLTEHEQRFSAAAPRKYEYLGTFKPLWKLEVDQPQYHQLWRYGTPDPPDMRVAAGDDQGAFTELAREYLGFVDQTRSGDEDFRLYRTAVEID